MAACRDHGEVRLEGKNTSSRTATSSTSDSLHKRCDYLGSTSIVIPAFNEAPSIGSIVAALSDAARGEKSCRR